MSYLSAYTDQYFDNESALHYYNARYYDSDLKRFTSIDPPLVSLLEENEEGNLIPIQERLLNPQDQNVYSYVTNNPIKYNDPTGEALEIELLSFDAPIYSYLGVNSTLGVKIGWNGINGYWSKGASGGAFFSPIGIGLTTEEVDVNAQAKERVSYTGRGAYVIGGSVSVSGDFNPSNPFLTNENTEYGASLLIGVGGAGSYEHTTETNWITFPWANDESEEQLEDNKNKHE